MSDVIPGTVERTLRSRGVDVARLEATLGYALGSDLLVLYAVVYAGLVVADSNTLGLSYLVLYPPLQPVVRAVVDVIDLVTMLVGYMIAAAGVVGVLKTVLEDALRQSDELGEPETDGA